MVRTEDMHPDMAKNLLSLDLPQIEPAPWKSLPPLSEMTIAIVTTAGLHAKDDRPFSPGSVEYRLVPGDLDFADLRMSHLSVNFDRSGFQQDINTVFPLERLRELDDAGVIGGISRYHYSFMGAQPQPERLQETGEEIGRLLRDDGVDAAFLTPV